MNSEKEKFEYIAFISYKREDEKWAKWLQKKLESYNLPVKIRKEHPEVPAKIRPVFRDQTDLSGGNLKEEIEKALEVSKFLIVICSPRAAQSPWVSKEVNYFIKDGRDKYIIPFIIGGVPNSSNPEEECFPVGLKELTGDKEILGININEGGKDVAFIKVIAYIVGIRFNILWRSYDKERKRRKLRKIFLISLIFITLIGFTIYISILLYKSEKENGKILSTQLYMQLDEIGGQNALKELSQIVKEKPFSTEIERAVRWALSSNKKFILNDVYLDHITPLPQENLILGVGNSRIYLIDEENGEVIKSEYNPHQRWLYNQYKTYDHSIFYTGRNGIGIISFDGDKILNDSDWFKHDESLRDFDILFDKGTTKTIALYTKENGVKIFNTNDTVIIKHKPDNFAGKIILSNNRPYAFIYDGIENRHDEGEIYCFDYDRNKVVWRKDLKTRVSKMLTRNEGKELILSGYNNQLLILNTDTGDIIKKYTISSDNENSYISDFIISKNENDIYCTIKDGDIYNIKLDKEEIIPIHLSDKESLESVFLGKNNDYLIVSAERKTFWYPLKEKNKLQVITDINFNRIEDIYLSDNDEKIILTSYSNSMGIYSRKDSSNLFISKKSFTDPKVFKNILAYLSMNNIIFKDLSNFGTIDSIPLPYNHDVLVSNEGSLLCFYNKEENKDFYILNRLTKDTVLISKSQDYPVEKIMLGKGFIDDKKNQIIVPNRDRDNNHGISVFDIQNGNNKQNITENLPSYIESLLLSKDRKYFLINGSTDSNLSSYNYLYVWDYNNLRFLYKLRTSDETIASFDISPDSRYIITSHYDGTLNFWDIESGLLIAEPIRLQRDIYRVKWGTNLEDIYIADYDGKISLIKFETWDNLKNLLIN